MILFGLNTLFHEFRDEANWPRPAGRVIFS